MVISKALFKAVAGCANKRTVAEHVGMNGIFVNPEKRSISATDTHVLVRVTFDDEAVIEGAELYFISNETADTVLAIPRLKSLTLSPSTVRCTTASDTLDVPVAGTPYTPRSSAAEMITRIDDMLVREYGRRNTEKKFGFYNYKLLMQVMKVFEALGVRTMPDVLSCDNCEFDPLLMTYQRDGVKIDALVMPMRVM